MKITKASIAHAPVIIDFQKKMAKETENIDLNINTLSQGIENVFLNPEYGNYYIVKYEEKIVACLLITNEWSDWRNGFVWWIQSVYVVPKFRRNGIFKKLYEHIKKLAIDNEQIKGLRLYVDKTNKKAINTYESVGMNREHYELFEWMKSS